MTQYIYIASPLRLPKGSFGSTPISPEQPNIFKDEYDFAELYFENNYDSETKRKFSYSPHFSFKYQVAVMSYHIPLKHWEKGVFDKLNLSHFYTI
ncbi:hypothetical protein E2K98_24985 [Bacillus salipaludis]|uniref:Uncharacterized protein n=1 Tax=Bacillus salipaludis TaxID=2547811 RepID=A0A4R5VJV4_9BACI|nr:hypothetical protein [Bacillus salipaludis]TDK58173.1 hypothetical protein E2K98_24985 [Bacillus salipaludis]